MEPKPSKTGVILAVLTLAAILARGIFDHWSELAPIWQPVIAHASPSPSPMQSPTPTVSVGAVPTTTPTPALTVPASTVPAGVASVTTPVLVPDPSTLSILHLPNPAPTASETPHRRHGTYRVEKASDTDPTMKIEKIEITSNVTILRMKYTNTRQNTTHPMVFSTTHHNAFTLYNEDYTEKYKLLDILSVDTDTDLTVAAGKSLVFTLKFERIPDAVERVNLLEGKGIPDPGRTAWSFYDVPLSDQ